MEIPNLESYLTQLLKFDENIKSEIVEIKPTQQIEEVQIDSLKSLPDMERLDNCEDIKIFLDTDPRHQSNKSPPIQILKNNTPTPSPISSEESDSTWGSSSSVASDVERLGDQRLSLGIDNSNQTESCILKPINFYCYRTHILKSTDFVNLHSELGDRVLLLFPSIKYKKYTNENINIFHILIHDNDESDLKNKINATFIELEKQIFENPQIDSIFWNSELFDNEYLFSPLDQSFYSVDILKLITTKINDLFEIYGSLKINPNNKIKYES